MKTPVSALGLAVLLAAGPALAGTIPGDTDGNDLLSLAELQAMFPTVTEAVYIAADTNHDGLLDEGELKTAQESGALPK